MFGNQDNKRPEITTKYSLVNHYKWKLIIFFLTALLKSLFFSPFQWIIVIQILARTEACVWLKKGKDTVVPASQDSLVFTVKVILNYG